MRVILLVLLAIAGPAFPNWSSIGDFAGHWLDGGECEYDLDDDNIVNFVDFALLINRGFDVALVADIDFVNKKNKLNNDNLIFVRSGIAYNEDGTFATDGQMRTDYVTVASPVEYTVIYGYAVLACDSNYVYACKTISAGELYRSRGADTEWEFLHDFSAYITSARITEKGTLLVACGARANENAGTLWRRNNDNTWTRVINGNTMVINSYVVFWAWSQLDGRIFVNEYKSIEEPNNNRCVYMSEDDGVTWTRIHNPDNVTGRHIHTTVPCYVNGEYRVYCSYGDGGGRYMCYLTEPNDGGTEWDETEIVLNFSQQNTSGFWLPEENCIIWGADGSDKSSAIIKHNLADDSFEVLQRTDFQWEGNSTLNANYKYLTIGRYGNIGIAPGSNNSTLCNHPYSGVWISDGFKFWAKAVCYQDGALHYAGIGPDGNIWIRIGEGGACSLCFSVPRTVRLQGALVERASSNVWHSDLHPPATADANTVVDNDYVVDRWDTDTACGRWRCDWYADGSYAPIENIRTLSIPAYPIKEVIADMSNGDMGFFTFWVKGQINDGSGNNMGPYKAGRAYATVKVAEVGSCVYHSKQEEVYFWPTNEWQKVVAHVTQDWTIENQSTSQISAQIVMPANGYEKTEFDLLIDGITLEKEICPSEWAPEDTRRWQDVLYYEPFDFPEAFTDIFIVASRFGSHSMGASATGDVKSYIYLRTYANDNDNFFAVVYDVYDKKIKLLDESMGINSVAAIIAIPVYLFDEEAFTIGVARSGTVVNLCVWAGGKYRTTSGTITNHTVHRYYWGSHPSGEQGGALVFVRDKMWNEAKSVNDMKKEMQWPEPLSN